MRRPSLIILLSLLFCAPFVLLILSYGAAPAELPVMRTWIDHTVLWAAKSPFMVFRVPLMNLIHGLMATIMLCRAPDFADRTRRDSYFNLFLALVLTIAIKSNLEALEFVSTVTPALKPYEHSVDFATLACVLVGLIAAMIAGRRVKIPWPELRLTIRDKIALSGLFATYLAIVAASIALGHRV
ncbi:MAG TPA: hypothetical protein VMD76_00840 [Candidatus Sulfotelmatobacter sp.]|jgi:hypothetical protein|nr:hypothetical protein [Candidatus Sulfotelmatobacter sp.]